jgi:hypothetical protein
MPGLLQVVFRWLRRELLYVMFTCFVPWCSFAGGRGDGAGEGPKNNCLVIKAEPGAPAGTIEEHVLKLRLDELPEAAKFLAHQSQSARTVRVNLMTCMQALFVLCMCLCLCTHMFVSTCVHACLYLSRYM